MATRVADVVDLPGEAASARILVPDGAALAVDVEGQRVLGVDRARVPLAHQLSHHAEQADMAVVEEDLGVVRVRLPHDDVSEVDVVDAVALP
jgi:hypothetical protein